MRLWKAGVLIGIAALGGLLYAQEPAFWRQQDHSVRTAQELGLQGTRGGQIPVAVSSDGVAVKSIEWSNLAAMLTVITISGGAFTWVISVIIDRKMSGFKESMRDGFVTKEMMDIIAKQADMTHERYERTFRDIFAKLS